VPLSASTSQFVAPLKRRPAESSKPASSIRFIAWNATMIVNPDILNTLGAGHQAHLLR
jgi:hypothetical protein